MKQKDTIEKTARTFQAGAERIILETERLYLREFAEKDLPDLSKILQNEKVMYAWEHAFTDDEVTEWYNRQIEKYDKCGLGYWAVIEKSSNKIIGQCGLLMVEINGENCLEIGYLFDNQYWHKGFATEAAAACKNYAFEKLKVETVFSTIRPGNIASQKVAERIGMKIEKEIIKRYYNKEILHYLYSIKNIAHKNYHK
jgi:RimJ/RimL family protein N-acetyltransferase